MDGGDLGLERRVDKPVAREEGLLVELGRDDYRVEGLAASAFVSECQRAPMMEYVSGEEKRREREREG